MGQHLDVVQKVCATTVQISKSQKLQQRRLELFIATKCIANTTYQIQNDNDPTTTKTVHRNHVV